MGLRCIVYIDDGICAASSNNGCVAARDAILSDLDKAGFVLSIARSCAERGMAGICPRSEWWLVLCAC